MSLSSCAGIGDGALTGNIQTSGDTVEEQNKEEIYCILTLYDASGNSSLRVILDGENKQEVIDLVEHGEYDNYREIDSLVRAHISVEFSEDVMAVSSDDQTVNPWGYRIYADGFVAEINHASSWMPGLNPLGKQEGIYERVLEIMEKVNEDIAKAEEDAGFAFDSLMIKTAAGKIYTPSDFSEIDCTSVSQMMTTKDGVVWWVLKIDSNTKEKLLDAVEKLEARDDILSVSLDYIMTIA